LHTYLVVLPETILVIYTYHNQRIQALALCQRDALRGLQKRETLTISYHKESNRYPNILSHARLYLLSITS